MNIDQAKNMLITEIFDLWDIKPKKERGANRWYLAPWRNENTASLKVNLKHNYWYDFGEGIGGDVIAFVRQYLKSKNQACTVSDGLRWLSELPNAGSLPQSSKILPVINEPKTLELKNIKDVQHPLLISYLASRGISLDLGRTLFKEAKIRNNLSGKEFFSLGFKNDAAGYELRNQFYKGCIGVKAPTFIRGLNPTGLQVFEGSFDYGTVLSKLGVKQLKDDTIVLNSLSLLQKAPPLIKNYDYNAVYSWLDNDKPGLKARTTLDEFLKAETTIKHHTMNHLYNGFKDVNEWYCHSLGLKYNE